MRDVDVFRGFLSAGGSQSTLDVLQLEECHAAAAVTRLPLAHLTVRGLHDRWLDNNNGLWLKVLIHWLVFVSAEI